MDHRWWSLAAARPGMAAAIETNDARVRPTRRGLASRRVISWPLPAGGVDPTTSAHPSSFGKNCGAVSPPAPGKSTCAWNNLRVWSVAATDKLKAERPHEGWSIRTNAGCHGPAVHFPSWTCARWSAPLGLRCRSRARRRGEALGVPDRQRRPRSLPAGKPVASPYGQGHISPGSEA